MNNDQFREKAHKLIPGGAHTYSRGDDQFPQNAPAGLKRGKAAYVWDLEEVKFLDYGMGLRSVGIGYAEDSINQAAIQQIQNGNNLTRASEIELQAAEDICNYIPSLEMVKFAKHGSAVTSAATKLARAITKRKLIARCIEQPFFSYDDWFIGNTVINSGIPEEIQKLTLNFHYNNIESLQKLFESYPGQIACVIMEPASSVEPCTSKLISDESKNFLHDVQFLCEKNETLFILDEMITGFRWHSKGAAAYYNIKPDLITFGKAMANGFSVAALGGKRKYMERGGIKHDQERIFLTSTTHGAEMCGMGALVETINFYKANDVTDHMWKYGKDLIDGANGISSEFGIKDYFQFSGPGCSPVYSTYDQNKNVSFGFRTLFSQEMIKHRILMPYVSISYSHRDLELEMTLNAIRNSLKIYKEALESGLQKYLVGNEIKPVFRKMN